MKVLQGLLAGAAASLLLTAVVGCEGPRVGASDRQTDFDYHSDPLVQHTPDEPAPRVEPARAPRKGPCPWPTQGGGGMAWSNMAYPTGDAATSAVGIEKGFPMEVRRNQAFDYAIVVTNLTNLTLENVVLTDELGPNLTINGASPSMTGGGVPTWNLGELGPCETVTVAVNATATADGIVGTCASISYNSQLCASVPVVSPELRVVKSGPAEVLRCDPITYNFVVTNTGTGAIDNVVVNDPLPSGLRSSTGGNSLSFNAGTLAAGQSKEFSAQVVAERTGEFSNRATASGGGLTAESGNVVTNVLAPSLEIDMDCDGQGFIDRTVTYNVTARNVGDGGCTGTTLEATVPSGSTFVSATGGGQLQGNRVVWNVGGLGANDSVSGSFVVSPNGSGTLRSTATVNCACADAVSDSCETVVKGRPAVLLECVDDPDPIRVGDQTTYTITVTNQGTAPDTNVRIVCNLEATQEAVSFTGATQGSVNGRTVTFAPIPVLNAKQQATFRVTVRAVAPGDTRFKVTMTTDELGRPVEETEATNLYE